MVVCKLSSLTFEITRLVYNAIILVKHFAYKQNLCIDIHFADII